jgi:1,2-diacylglycerol 3-alpha-glucosyltransferase
MKIAIFTDVFLPYISGVSTAVTSLAKGLADRGHKIYIFVPKYKQKYKEFRYHNVTVVRIPAVSASRIYRDMRLAFPFDPKILRIIRKNNIELIHFHTPGTISMEAISIAKLLQIPLVGTFHTFIADPDYLSYIKINHPFMQKIAWEYSNMFYNRCDLISSPSVQTRKEMMRNGCTRPVKVISNGIDLSMFDNKLAGKVRKRYGLTPGKTVLFIGRLGLEKNLMFLIDCFISAAKKVPEARLIIVGDGPMAAELRAHARAEGFEKRIIFTGRIENDTLVKSGIFGASDIFATASLTENQPVTILEAQANGLVCIGANAKGIPDLIIDGMNGILAPRNSRKDFSAAIYKLLTDKRLYSKLKKGTLKEIKRHDRDNVIDAWEKTYSELIRRKSENSRPKLIDLKQHRKVIKQLFGSKIRI